MRHVDVERIRIRVNGPAAGWNRAAAAAVGEHVLRALADAALLGGGGSVRLGVVDAGTVRVPGGAPAAAAARVAERVAGAVGSAARRPPAGG